MPDLSGRPVARPPTSSPGPVSKIASVLPTTIAAITALGAVVSIALRASGPDAQRGSFRVADVSGFIGGIGLLLTLLLVIFFAAAGFRRELKRTAFGFLWIVLAWTAAGLMTMQ